MEDRLPEKIVSIVGKGSGWEEIEENKSPGVVIGLNDICLQTDKIDFSIHMHEAQYFSKEFIAYHERTRRPVFSVSQVSNYEWLNDYPLSEIILAFDLPVPYFSSGQDYALAYALYCGYNVFNLYGINVARSTEYESQKPNTEFWLGVAIGRGCRINLQHKWSVLMRNIKQELYGYNEPQWINY